MSDNKLNIDDIDFIDNDEEEVYDVVTFVNDDNVEEDFFVIDGIDVDKVRYLLLVRTKDYDKEEPEAFIFKEVEVDEENCTYEPVEDEAEYKKIMILLENENSDYTIEM
ncbi:MAG: DUF1292 domain-containing protein [Lachnospirales bacterium]